MHHSSDPTSRSELKLMPRAGLSNNQSSVRLPHINNSYYHSNDDGIFSRNNRYDKSEPTYRLPETESGRFQTIDVFTNTESKVNPELVEKAKTKNILLKRYVELEEIQVHQKNRERSNEVNKKTRRQKGSMFIADLWDRNYYKSVLKYSGIDKMLEQRRRARWQSLDKNLEVLESQLHKSKNNRETNGTNSVSKSSLDESVEMPSNSNYIKTEDPIKEYFGQDDVINEQFGHEETPKRSLKHIDQRSSVPLTLNTQESTQAGSTLSKNRKNSYSLEKLTTQKKIEKPKRTKDSESYYYDSGDMSQDYIDQYGLVSKLRDGMTTKRVKLEVIKHKYKDFFDQVGYIAEGCSDIKKDKEDIIKNIASLGKVIVPTNLKKKQEEQASYELLRKNDLIKEFVVFRKNNEKKRIGYDDILRSVKEQIRRQKEDIRMQALATPKPKPTLFSKKYY